MKNKIIKTALISFLLTSSINLVSASENTFYLKPFISGVMGDKMTNTSLYKTFVNKKPEVTAANHPTGTNPDIRPAYDLRNIYSEYGANLGIAAGYNILEHVRIEAELSYVNNIEYQGTGFKPNTTRALTDQDAITPTISHTGWTACLNSYVDIVNTGPVRFFLSGGLGASYLESKITGSDKITVADQHAKIPTETGAIVPEPHEIKGLNGTYKQEWDLAYNLGLGVSFELNENYLMDVSYKYNNYGKPGNNNATPPAAWGYDNRASHNLNLGLRFNI